MSAIRALRKIVTPLAGRRSLCMTSGAVPRVGGMRVASLASSSRTVSMRGFASSVKRSGEGSTDVALSQKLQEELKYEKETGGAQDEAPQFLKDFEAQGVWSIQDVLGFDEVTLSRKFGNENIADIQSGEEPFPEEGEEGEAEPVTYPIHASLTITKSNGTGAIAVDMMVQEGHFITSNISFYDDAQLGTELTADADWKRRGLYIGPQFDTLDVAVQDEFEAFLRERGIDESLAHFIPQFAEFKEQKEYVKWLGKVNAFVNL